MATDGRLLGGPDALIQPRHPIAVALAVSAVALAIAVGSPIVYIGLVLVLFLTTIFLLSAGDAVTVLSIGVLAMFLLPQRFVFEPLGAAGTPALLVGVGAFVWWGVSRLSGSMAPSSGGYNPVRLTTFILFAAVLASFAAAWARPLVDVEGRNADRTFIMWLGYAGYLLLTADGVDSRSRLDTLLRRVVDGAALMSIVALAQFFASFDVSEALQPPGLTFNTPEFSSSFQRGTFTRVAGTAMHPIEFSVVVAAILPLGLHYAFNDLDRGLLRRWAPVALMGFAMPLAISRSGFLGLAVAGLCLLPALPAGRRVVVAALGVLGAMAMTVVVPGLLGTIRSFFVNTGVDPSIASRTQDYELLNVYFEERPWFGRGFGTFLPSLYDFLDNQYLLTAIEMGIVGFVALALFLLGGMLTAQVVRRRRIDEPTSFLAQALFAGVAVHAATFATYDALTFPTAGMTLFLLIGAIGALWRLTRPARALATAAEAVPTGLAGTARARGSGSPADSSGG